MKKAGNHWVKALTLGFAVSLSAGFTASAEEDSPESNWNLMLMGNSPQICSSMNQDACASTDWINANETRTARLFNLSDVRRKEAMRRAIWPRSRDDVRDSLIEALDEMADYFGYGVVPEYRFVERLRSRAYLQLIAQLTEAEYNRLLDSLEMPRLEGLNEEVNLEETRDSSANLIRDFVAMAAESSGHEQPTVLVVTAAARDSFRDVEFYSQTFEAAGAKARWLPMDATVARAQAERLCESLDSLRRSTTGAFDRARVYPEMHSQQEEFCQETRAWEDMLADADAIFIADGDQSRLRNTFFIRDDTPSPLLDAMQGALQRGDLVVGAAGAGAVGLSSGIMITSGSSREAIVNGAHARRPPAIDCERDDSCPRDLNADSLTYHAMGGLGLYPFGIVDTEVSERGRQGRLLRLAEATSSPLATGIDRATALFVNTESGEFQVQGDSAVTVFESPQGNARMVAAGFHLLRHNSTGRFARGQVTDIELAEQSPYRPESTTTRFLGDTGVYDNVARLCEGRSQVQLLQDDFALLMQSSDDTETRRAEGRCQVAHATMGIAWQPEEQR